MAWGRAEQRPSAVSRDPRASRTRIRVLTAAVEELGATGYGQYTVESIADRARVAKSTVYRHWPDKLALIADALETFHDDLVPPQVGAARDHIVSLVAHVAAILSDSPFAACIPALIDGARHDDTVAAFHFGYGRARRAELAAAIRSGIAEGDIEPGVDVDLAVVMLLRPLFHSRLMSERPFKPGRAAQLVNAVLPRAQPD